MTLPLSYGTLLSVIKLMYITGEPLSHTSVCAPLVFQYNRRGYAQAHEPLRTELPTCIRAPTPSLLCLLSSMTLSQVRSACSVTTPRK